MITHLSGMSTTQAESPSSGPESYYDFAIKAAQRKVDRQKALAQPTAGVLSSSLIKSLLGRYYQVGDHWDVAAWKFDHSTMRKIDDSDHLKARPPQSGVFHYEVVELLNGAQPEIKIRVTQIPALGMATQDRRIQELNLVMTDRISQSQKEYRFNGSDQPVRVSPEGIRSAMTPWELFPLDVPELYSAVYERPRALPTLPDEVRAFTQRNPFNPDLSKSRWFEQDDFFGRPIQVLWQKGDPWPAYMKTPNGIALLIRGTS